MKLKLTEKGRAVFTHLNELEAALAAIWREPYETYDVANRIDWVQRRTAATQAFQSAMDDALGDQPDDLSPINMG